MQFIHPFQAQYSINQGYSFNQIIQGFSRFSQESFLKRREFVVTASIKESLWQTNSVPIFQPYFWRLLCVDNSVESFFWGREGRKPKSDDDNNISISRSKNLRTEGWFRAKVISLEKHQREKQIFISEQTDNIFPSTPLLLFSLFLHPQRTWREKCFPFKNKSCNLALQSRGPFVPLNGLFCWRLGLSLSSSQLTENRCFKKEIPEEQERR